MLVGTFLLVLHFIRVQNEIISFNNSTTSNQNSKTINDFVNRLLPKHIQESINSQSGAKMGEVYDNVTLLFADIVGFTAFSAGKQPKEVVSM